MCCAHVTASIIYGSKGIRIIVRIFTVTPHQGFIPPSISMGQRATKGQGSSSPSLSTNTQSMYRGARNEPPATRAENTTSHQPPPSRRSGQDQVTSPPALAGRGDESGRPSSRTAHPPPPVLPPKQSSVSSSTGSKLASLEKFFLKYKDEGEDAILAEGIEKFCIDLGVEPTDYIVLLIAWRFRASEMCRFSREEFINGCQRLRAHDTRSLKQRFPDLMEETRTERNFKDLYQFTFSFGLDHSSGQRSLPIEMAIPLWELVFSQKRPPILEQWFAYLQSSSADIRGISRDTWNMFLPFVTTITTDFKNYDESEAWPSLFDDFVEHELEKL